MLRGDPLGQRHDREAGSRLDRLGRYHRAAGRVLTFRGLTSGRSVTESRRVPRLPVTAHQRTTTQTRLHRAELPLRSLYANIEPGPPGPEACCVRAQARADGARAQHAAGPSRVRWPAVCGRTPAQSHCQSPLCREARPPSLCLVAKPRAQGTGPDWGRLVFHPGLPHPPCSRGRRAGPWGEGARSRA